MENIILSPNEGIIIEQENVRYEKKSGKLVLTNQNLIFIHLGILKKPKEQITIPLKKIKIVDGIVQAILHKATYPELQVYLTDGQANFFFQTNNKTVIEWIHRISLLLTNEKSHHESIKSSVAKLYENIAFGMKERATKTLTIPCISCKATLTGTIKSKIQCPYCDTIQIIEKRR